MGLLFPPFSTQSGFCRRIHTLAGEDGEKLEERVLGGDGSSDEEEGAEKVQDKRLYP